MVVWRGLDSGGRFGHEQVLFSGGAAAHHLRAGMDDVTSSVGRWQALLMEVELRCLYYRGPPMDW